MTNFIYERLHERTVMKETNKYTNSSVQNIMFYQNYCIYLSPLSYLSSNVESQWQSFMMLFLLIVPFLL
jgi:hypothetical protein